jgi:hypothetical protein
MGTFLVFPVRRLSPMGYGLQHSQTAVPDRSEVLVINGLECLNAKLRFMLDQDLQSWVVLGIVVGYLPPGERLRIENGMKEPIEIIAALGAQMRRGLFEEQPRMLD